MGSGASFQIARIFGIRIGVNISWFFVLFLFIVLLSDSFNNTLSGDQSTAYPIAVAAALAFFASIVLHEFGHALAARHSGIEVKGIDLFFFGGIMKTARDSDSPGTEFKVAIAGPIVTLGIILLGSLGGAALAGGWSSFLDAALLRGAAAPNPATLLVSFLVTMNTVLLVFNMIPAYPLDGGRVARAVAWWVTGDKNKGTRFAARIGQGFSYLLIGFGGSAQGCAAPSRD